MAKKLIIWGHIIFEEADGQPISATIQKIDGVMLVDENSEAFIEKAEDMGKEGEDWIIPHLYKGTIIWK